jgi:ABC-type antimicrobial peptide transport system permease subunit
VEQLSGPLIIIAVILWFTVDNWTGSRAKTAREQRDIEARKLALEKRKMEFEGQKLLLEKCQTTEEVSQFLATDAGKGFLERVKGSGVAPPVYANPLGGIMALIVFGALLVGLGLAFFLLSRFTTHSALIIPALLLSVPGLGLLIGAAVSYHLKKKWGLLKRDPAAPAI